MFHFHFVLSFIFINFIIKIILSFTFNNVPYGKIEKWFYSLKFPTLKLFKHYTLLFYAHANFSWQLLIHVKASKMLFEKFHIFDWAISSLYEISMLMRDVEPVSSQLEMYIRKKIRDIYLATFSACLWLELKMWLIM